MKTCVIYARYSSSNQTEQSIEGQLDVCSKYAKENNLHIVNTYIDRAMTGTNDNRPDFQKMLSDSERENWEVVLVYAIDRFGRDSVEIAINKHRLKKNGKMLISATQRTSENLDGTINLDGILLENIYIGMAEYYSKELAQKIRRGLRESRKKGQFCGGTIPYGYYAKDKHLYEDEEKAEIIRFIFDEYAHGTTIKNLQKKLNANGYLHYGKPFSSGCLYHILRNEKYAGITNINGESFNLYPALVSQETFDTVRKRVDANKYGKTGVEDVYLLKGKIRCGYCGHSMGARCTTSNGKKVRYYKCRGTDNLKSGCKKTSIRKHFLEKFILDHICETLSSGEESEKIISHIMEYQEKQTKDRPEIKTLEKEKKQTETALHNVMAAIEQGIVSNTTAARLQELESKLEEIDKRLLIEKSKTIYTLSKAEVKAFYKTALELEPQMLINYLVDEIIMYNDSVEIRYKSPVSKSPDDSQGFSFYKKTVLMPFVGHNQKGLVYKELLLIKSI